MTEITTETKKTTITPISLNYRDADFIESIYKLKEEIEVRIRSLKALYTLRPEQQKEFREFEALVYWSGSISGHFKSPEHFDKHIEHIRKSLDSMKREGEE